MAVLDIKKLTSDPGTYAPNTLYFIAPSNSPNELHIIVSSNDGSVARHTITKAEVQNMITSAIQNISDVKYVADIPARNALTLTSDALVYVNDATGDPAVISGGALYYYKADTQTFINTTPRGLESAIGTIIRSVRNDTPPGYLKCNGARVSKTTYSELYSIIGDTYTPIIEDAGIPWLCQYGFNPSVQNGISGWRLESNNLIVNTAASPFLVTKNYIYLLGGYNSGSGLNNIQRASFDANGNLTSGWSNVGTLPTAMWSMGFVAAKGRFYLIGGRGNSGVLSTVYSAPINLDGTLGAFRAEVSLPAPRFHITCFVIKDKLYVVGGYNGSSYTNTIYRAKIHNDGTLRTWETFTNFPITTSHGKPMLIKDRIYIFGAYDNSSNTSKIYYTLYNNFGDIGSWNYVSNTPGNMYATSVVCTNNYVFILGGYDTNVGGRNTIYVAPILSDGSIGSWTQTGNTPITAYYAQTPIAGNRIYFIGGVNNNRSFNNVYSVSFVSGITDYTPYYADSIATDPNYFYLPNCYLDNTSIGNWYIKTGV